MRKKLNKILLFIFISFIYANRTIAQCEFDDEDVIGCSKIDLLNYGINSNNNPETIEYDNIVCGFHTNIIRNENEIFTVWGQQLQNNGTGAILSPTLLTNTTYPAITGTHLKAVTTGLIDPPAGSPNGHQHVVLTTDGLFVWGIRGVCLDASLTPNNTFQPLIVGGNPQGLPPGVAPLDVKMLFGTSHSLAITTCSGEVYVLSQNSFARGDGSTGTNTAWSQVMVNNTTPLTGIISTRGWYAGFIALKDDNTLWTWGENTYLGDNTVAVSRDYATQMVLPPGVGTIKMIGMTGGKTHRTFTHWRSYYILSTNGRLFTMGDNSRRQLGDFTTTERLSWVNAMITSGTPLEDIAWISPNEHDDFHVSPSISILTKAGVMYNFGGSSGGHLGRGTGNVGLNPGMPTGTFNSDILAIETSGHLSMAIKECSHNFFYTGHRTNGSMGNGSAADATEALFTNQTAQVNIYGARSVIVPQICTPTSICAGDTLTVLLANNFEGSVKWQLLDTLTNTWSYLTNPSTNDTLNNDTLRILPNGNSCYRAEITIQDCDTDYHYSNTVCIEINPLPEAIITGDTIVCKDSEEPQVNFIGSMGTAPYTFTYTYGPDTLTITSVGDTATVFAPTNLTDTLIYNLISVKDASSTSCEQRQNSTSTIIIHPLPTGTILGNIEVCHNSQNPTVTFTGSNGTAPYTFYYRLNDIPHTISSTEDDTTILIPTVAIDTFTIILDSISDDEPTICTQLINDTIKVIVNPLPQGTVSGSTIVCVNDSSPQVTFSGNNGIAPYTFHYRLNGVNQTITSTTNDTILSLPTLVADTFLIILDSISDTSPSVCMHTQNDTLEVIVNPLPQGTVSGNAIVCINDNNPQVTFSGSSGTAPYTFYYRLNGVNQTIVSTANDAILSLPTLVADTFLIILDSISDTSPSICMQTQNDTVTVIINPLPQGMVSGNATVCINDIDPQVTFSGSNGIAPYTFYYRVNGVNQTIVSTANDTILSLPTLIADTFVIILDSISDNSPSICMQTGNDLVTIVVNPLPHGEIIGSTVICVNDSNPQVTFSGSNGTAPYTFYYTLNGISQVISTIGTSHSISTNVSSLTVDTFVFILDSISDASISSCQRLINDTVTIVVSPLPYGEISGTTVVCRNDSSPLITFTGSDGYSGNYIFTYRINNGAVQNLSSLSGYDSATLNVPTNIVGTFVYELIRVTDSVTGCTNLINQNQTIVVNPIPSATITGSSIVCQNSTGSSVTFTGSNSTSEYRFTYSVNGSPPQSMVTSGSNTAVIDISTIFDTVYTYKLISIEDTATGCIGVQTDSVVIRINPVPAAISNGSIEICQDTAPYPFVTFRGINSLTGSYAFDYTINGGPVQTITTSVDSVTIVQPTNIPNTYVYTLISVMDPETMCAVHLNSVDSVIIRPLPMATISLPSKACYLDTILPEVQFTGSNGDTPYTFTYTINGGSPLIVTSTGIDTVIQQPTDTLGTFIYTITHIREGSSLGCEQNQNVSTQIKINDLPIVDAGNDIIICEKVSVILAASGAQIYEWNHHVTNGIAFTPPLGTTTYTVTGTDYNGCKNTDSLIIDVIPIPTMDITGQNLYGCQPIEPTFTNNSTGNFTNCTWYLGNGEVVNNCATFSSVFTEPGCFDVTLEVTTPEGCKNTLTMEEYVCVEANPVADFYPSPSELTTSNWESQMINQSIGATNYIWRFGDETGEKYSHSPVHHFPNNEEGTYIITLIASTNAGCVDTATAIVYLKEELLFYVPNTFTPDHDHINDVFKPVFSTGFDLQNYTMYIFNRWGELIFETHDAEIGWNGSYGMDGNSCQDGTYTWKIELLSKSSNEKKQYVGHVNLLK